MDIVIDAGEHDGIPVLGLRGELDLSTVPRARDRFVRAIAQHPGATVVIDLDGVAHLDDAGLGLLVASLGRVRAHGGDLVLVCSPGRLLDDLHRCRLDRVFEIHATVTAALASARAQAPPDAPAKRA